MGITTSNPIARLKKPAYEPCEKYLTQEQFDELIVKAKDECFRDYLNFLWFTGCRPQEIRLIEAEHVQGDKIVLTKKDSKGKKYNRTIYLNDDAVKMIKRLSVHKSGPLFRNSQGNRWTSNAIRCRFKRLDVDGLCARMLRHSWITNALQNGLDTTTVAILAGHRDTTMVQRNYQHLAQNHKFLTDAARKATNGGNKSP